MRSRIMAVTNAMWMQRHSKGAGAVFGAKSCPPWWSGMATLIVYKDGSVDIQEWGPDIPVHLVRDARLASSSDCQKWYDCSIRLSKRKN